MALPFENKASVGRDVAVFFSTTASTTPPVDYVELAATRGLEDGVEWETVDTTARGTASGNSRTSLVTYSNNNLSIDGLVITNNQGHKDLLSHIRFPPASTNNQPTGWVKTVEPDGAGGSIITEYPVLYTQWRRSQSYDAERTWTLECESQGDPVPTTNPA